MNKDPQKLSGDELDEAVDASLRRQFTFEAPGEDHIQRLLAHVSPPAETPPHVVTASQATSRRLWWWGMLATAATVGWLLVARSLWLGDSRMPVFEPQQLAQIYATAVEAGFEPYYVCEDDARFADTFQQRQGIAIKLADLPPHMMMEGLSYTGGLSRTTTAMLGRVNGEPVMVFVEQLDADDPQMAKEVGDIHVYRQARDGLVFYEVSQLDQAYLADFMVVSTE